MKFFYSFSCFLLFFSLSFQVQSQVSESFANIPTNSSGQYLERTWIGDDGHEWKATEARTDQTINGKAITFRGTTGHLINTSPISGGCGTLSFNYKRVFSGNSTIQVFVNGTQYGGNITVSSETPAPFSAVVNVSGNISLEIKNLTSGKRVVIDDLVWTAYSASLNTTVQFLSTASSINEDGISIDVCVGITNEDPTNATTVDIVLDGSSTTTNGDDYDDGAASAIVFPKTITFPPGSAIDQCLTIHIIDDMDIEGEETVILNLQNPGGGNAAALGTTVQHTLTIVDNDVPSSSNIRINEVDSSPAGDEFIELFGDPGLPLSGLVVVLFNGDDASPVDASYDAFDLDGHVLDANGYFIIGKSTSMPAGVDPPEIVLTGSIQDGTDAVGLYLGDASEFDEVSPTNTNLIDACVYASGDPDDSVLRLALDFTAANGHADLPINEAENGARPTESVQRGSWFVSLRTPRAANENLPIQLLSFNVEKQDDFVKIDWQTAAELNNDYFAIEWSTDGKTFQEIKRVRGSMDSRNISEYEVMHTNPAEGINYYRLSQVDLDGTRETFPIKTITFSESDKGFSIQPTLVNSHMNIRFGQKVTEGTLLILNSTGLLVNELQLESGIGELELNMSALSSGTYFIQYVQIGGSSTERFVKM